MKSVTITPPLNGIESISMYLFIAIIIGVAIGLYIHVQRLKKQGNLINNRRQVEMFPSLVSTLGVLGTFIGISIGLLNFNPDELEESIPELLAGLKTAFFTSIAGMISSLVLSKVINKLYDKETDGHSDINDAANLICKSVKALEDKISLNASNRFQYYETVSSSLQSIVSEIGNLKECTVLMSKNNDLVENLYTDLKQRFDIFSDLLQKINTEELSKELRKGIAEIKVQMNDTNQLLSDKFDDFSVLLQKNNTEALVEVMKKVTEEFQSQMNALISKLVTENFEQLNNSVEKLNKWQIENKEMIQSLTSQYKEMTINFEQTSTTLTHVKENTESMVGSGGKLSKLVNALNEVIIEDEKFKSISTDLQQTAELSKTNMESFDQSTKKLNDWVKKQRDFTESVVALIEKLNELNAIKDYAGEFWKETKTGMNEAVSIIRRGSDDLNTQINGLDEKFYARLSTTLRNLDTCIQAIMDKNTK